MANLGREALEAKKQCLAASHTGAGQVLVRRWLRAPPTNGEVAQPGAGAYQGQAQHMFV